MSAERNLRSSCLVANNLMFLLPRKLKPSTFGFLSYTLQHDANLPHKNLQPSLASPPVPCQNKCSVVSVIYDIFNFQTPTSENSHIFHFHRHYEDYLQWTSFCLTKFTCIVRKQQRKSFTLILNYRIHTEWLQHRIMKITCIVGWFHCEHSLITCRCGFIRCYCF